MPWPWVIIGGLIGIGVFNLGAVFLLSPRGVGLPLLFLTAGLVFMGQTTLAVGCVGGGVLLMGTVLLAMAQWRCSAVVPRQQTWWPVVLGAVALMVVALTAGNGRVSSWESWTLVVVGVASYWLAPHPGKSLPWWRWGLGLVLVAGSSTLIAWSMPTMVAVSGCSPLVMGTLLAPAGLISTAVWWWQQRQTQPAVVVINAAVRTIAVLMTVGYGIIGIWCGGWVIGATTQWLTLPWLGLTLLVAVGPLLTRQKTSKVGGVSLLAVYLTYWLLLSI